MKFGISMSKRWEMVYQQWKSRHPNAAKKDRAQIVRDCNKKAAHQDWWTASIHAKALEAMGFKPAIYNCPLCKCEHVATRKGWDKWWERKENYKLFHDTH